MKGIGLAGHVARVGMRNAYKERLSLEDLGVDWKIILK
jgi:hypothetical protein